MTAAIPPTGVWWHVYPLGFLGAEPSARPEGSPIEHRLELVDPWLDYAVTLGVEGLVLGPVFASESHGYDTVDHFRVDPRLGDEDDLVRLISAAHQRGLRVVLDGVFNHVGRGFAKFGDALRDGPGSEAAGWFRLRWPEGGGPPVAEGFEGHGHLVALDHGNPAVADHVVAVLDHWCNRGVDGWRMDAAYAVPTAFWSEVCERLRRRHPQAWLFGEVIHGDYPAFVRDSGLDAVTQYELWKAVGSALNDGNFYELAHALERHQGFLDAFVPVTFLGNHDTTRIASLLGDVRHLPHALVVLFGVGGTPVVYAGDEQAFRGVKYEREHGDDEVRPAFPARPEELSLLGRETFLLHQRLIAFRAARLWLTRARTAVTTLTNTTLVCVSASQDGADRIAFALSLEGDSVALPLPEGSWAVAEGEGAVDGSELRLPARGWAVLAAV